MAHLQLTDVRKAYGDAEVLHGINLDIPSGEFVVFVGPSGCGKSTLLRTIAGLEEISSGALAFDGTVVNHLSPSKRGIAMVFQSYALYPHMTVFDNMAFGLKLAGGGRDAIRAKVTEAAEILQITDYLDRLPKHLSGGQRQRVAIGRAIVRDPKVFLFDEPLSNLDAGLRGQTRIEIARLHERMPGATMIYVTHDQVEAMTLADRIVVLRDGFVEQVGTPMELYRSPANLFVAQFIGSPSMNVIQADLLDSGQLLVRGADADRPIPVSVEPDYAAGRVSLGVRPEDLRMTEDDTLFTGRIDLVEKLGEVQLLYVQSSASDDPLIAKVAGDIEIRRGASIGLTADIGRLHVFDSAGRSISKR